jgi:uncharacterized membrane protein
MDDATKKIFQGKFIRLVVLLNIDVFFFFLAAILYFLLLDRVPYALPLTGISLILALVFTFIFVRRYRETRAWLDEHA